MSEIQIEPASELITSASNIADAAAHFSLFHEIKKRMRVGIHYGKIPGIEKPTLFQPGAQFIAKAFGLVCSLDETASQVDLTIPFVSYSYKCTVTRKGVKVGEGVGSCNSFEDKYAYTAWQTFPQPPTDEANKLKADALGRRYKNQNGEWVWQQRELCPPQIAAGKMNTIQKMAAKRALVHAVLNTTGGSEYFTQDIEDMPDVISQGEKIAAQEAQIRELRRFVDFAIDRLAVGRPDLTAIFNALPSLHTDQPFIAKMREGSAKYPK